MEKKKAQVKETRRRAIKQMLTLAGKWGHKFNQLVVFTYVARAKPSEGQTKTQTKTLKAPYYGKIHLPVWSTSLECGEKSLLDFFRFLHILFFKLCLTDRTYPSLRLVTTTPKPDLGSTHEGPITLVQQSISGIVVLLRKAVNGGLNVLFSGDAWASWELTRLPRWNPVISHPKPWDKVL